MNARKLADRETFNDWVWRKVIVQSQKFSEIARAGGSYEIRTDGVAVSVLFSREAVSKADKIYQVIKGLYRE